MTLDLVLARARLKELRAIERVRRAIIANASDSDWLYVVQTLDTRLDELRDQLAREDPELELRDQLAREDPELLRRCDQEVETDFVRTERGAIDIPKQSIVH